MRRLLILLVLLASVITLSAQETTPEPSADTLTAGDIDVVAELTIFDQVALMAQGQIINATDMAHENVSILAEAYDADDELIGEGFGILVDACGTGLLPDFALQPGESQLFSAELELFEDDVDIERVEVSIGSTEVDPTGDNAPEELTGITRVTDLEVVDVEWLNEEGNLIRYGVGCDRDVFTNLDWYQYNVLRGDSDLVQHPQAVNVTTALLEQLGLTDPFIYERSNLTFSPTSRRLLHQTDLSVIISAEPDGSFRRLIWDDLARFSLQGFIWMPEGRFLAYYFGGIGDPVRYFTASVEGQRISGSVYNTTPSVIVPGPTPDGARAVIAGEIDGTSGYFVNNLVVNSAELLFEGDYPGNNYPAPIYVPNDGQTIVYLVRPIDGEPHLQCYDTTTSQLNDLTALPLEIDLSTRAWTWLSPNGSQIALAANGVNGGMWLIDLDVFGRCAPEIAG